MLIIFLKIIFNYFGFSLSIKILNKYNKVIFNVYIHDWVDNFDVYLYE